MVEVSGSTPLGPTNFLLFLLPSSQTRLRLAAVLAAILLTILLLEFFGYS